MQVQGATSKEERKERKEMNDFEDVEEGWVTVGTAYELLKLNRDAPEMDDATIESAFLAAVDSASDEDEKLRIRESFETLRTETRRNGYNQALDQGHSRPQALSDSSTSTSGTEATSTAHSTLHGGITEMLFGGDAPYGRLLQAISKLRGSFELQLPQIVVCGMESEGKSSTLERLAMRNVFPRDKGFCTRLPVRLMMRNIMHQNEVTIRLKDTKRNIVLQQSAPHYCQTSDQTDEPFATQVSEIIRNFILEQHPDDDGFNVITDHEVQVEIRAPNVPTIDLVDLPGIVTAPEQAKHDTEELTRKMLQTPHTLALAVVSGTARRLRNNGIWPFLQQVNTSIVVALTMVDVPGGDICLASRLLKEGHEIPFDVPIASIVPLVNRDTGGERAVDHRSLQNSVAHERDILQRKCEEHGIKFDESQHGIVALLNSVNDMLRSYMRETWVDDELKRIQGELQRLFSQLWELGTKPNRVSLAALQKEFQSGFEKLVRVPTKAWLDINVKPLHLTVSPCAELLKRLADTWQTRVELEQQIPSMVSTVWEQLLVRFQNEVMDTSELPIRIRRFEGVVQRILVTVETFMDEMRLEIERTSLDRLSSIVASELSSESDQVDVQLLEKRLWNEATIVTLRFTFANPKLFARVGQELETCFKAGIEESSFVAQIRDALEEKVEAVYSAKDALLDLRGVANEDNIGDVFERARCFSEGGPTESVPDRTPKKDDSIWHFAPYRLLVQVNDTDARASHPEEDRTIEEAQAARTCIIQGDLSMLCVAPTGTILSVMDEYQDNAQVQEHACHALADFASREKEKAPLVEQGVVERILRAMKNHTTNSGVQEHACRALANLATKNDNSTCLREKGPAQAILRAMESHKMNARVQVFGCSALAKIAAIIENRASLVEDGVIEGILGAMDNHQTNACVQENACFVFANLCLAEENQQALIKLGAVERILRGMDEHKGDVRVQDHACLVLSILAKRDEHHATLMEQGAAERILSAKATHVTNTCIQDHARLALWNLAGKDGRTLALMEEGMQNGAKGAEVWSKLLNATSPWQGKGLKIRRFLTRQSPSSKQ